MFRSFTNGSKCSLASYEGWSWKEGKARESGRMTTMSLPGSMTSYPYSWSFWACLPLFMDVEYCVWLRRVCAEAVMTYVFKQHHTARQTQVKKITNGILKRVRTVSCAFLWSLPRSIRNRRLFLFILICGGLASASAIARLTMLTAWSHLSEER